MTSLAHLLTATAERHADRPALELDGARLDYSAFDAAASRVAGLLKERGLQPGDRVGLMLPNVPYFPVIYYGILRAGGVVVPMNVLLKGREVNFYLSDPGARHLFAWHDFAAAAEEGARQAGAEAIIVAPGEFERLLEQAPSTPENAEREGDDTAVILYTSGTTGTPKGAELTHENLYRNAEVTARTLAKATEEDVILGALPLFHAFGQTCAMNVAVLAGACLTLIPRFAGEKALEIIKRDGVTVFEGVPTMYHALLGAGGDHDVSSLRLCISGGAAMPVEIMRQFEEAFGCIILEGYGLSETSPVASFNHPDQERKPGSIGTRIEGVEMKRIDGEIAIRGHNVMKGYRNKPDATA